MKVENALKKPVYREILFVLSRYKEKKSA